MSKEIREMINKVKNFNKDKIINYPLDDINNWYGDCNYKNNGGKMIYMAPEEFLSVAKKLEMDDDTIDNVNILKNHILSGGKLDPLVIYSLDKTKARNSDGRHRAIASKELGIKKVPVIDYTGTL